MKREIAAIILFVFLAPALKVQAQSLITPAEAIHLVEYKLEEIHGGRFTAAEVVINGHNCTVAGANGPYRLLAELDARRARVLRITRDGQPFYKWAGVKIVGHRGCVKFTPENTIPAFLKGIELGVDLLEMDVRETKDGELVIMHDEKVDRTTDGKGRVADLTLAEIKSLDAGAWFAPEFRGVQVPTFREVLTAIQGKALPDIDFKSGDPQKLIALLHEFDLLGKVTLYCGDWDLMQATLTLAPAGFMLRPTIPGVKGLPLVLQKFDPQIVNIDWKEFSEPLVQAVHIAGKKSFLNAMQQDTDYVRRLMINTLPDYLQTDDLDLLAPVLREMGLHK